MARERQRQTVDSSFATPWKPTAIGELIEGIYIGSDKINTGNRAFTSFRIKPDEGDYIIGVAGAMLESKMRRIPKKTYVWITFTGYEETKNGRAHAFNVECEKGTELVDIFDDNDIPF